MIQGTLDINTEKKLCYHCGETCPDDSYSKGDKLFCCLGCKTVYEILEEKDLCNYYTFDNTPGQNQKAKAIRNYDFLEDSGVKSKFISFSNGKTALVNFIIPNMHCSSCIWILEHLYRFNPAILSSRVNFLRKSIAITFDETRIKLKEIVSILDSIGYEPLLNLEGVSTADHSENRSLYYKIGIAGFCFGNIMMLSFPEYLALGDPQDLYLRKIFSYINVVLSLPVFFYGASDYFVSAWKGIRKRIVNIDIPIALGVLVLFLRSLIEIVAGIGPGYLDSLSGLIFFLLIGRVFQNKTYEWLNFERNYRSYFPISVHIVLKDGTESSMAVEKIEPGTRALIRNNEIIPADSILIKGLGKIDYSFVTGEAAPADIQNGEFIYAGGRQAGSAIEVEFVKSVSHSYLTQLWNNYLYSGEKESRTTQLANNVSKYFTPAIILLASGAAVYNYFIHPALIWDAFTAVLIVACPCALALSTPFTLGNALRILAKNKFFMKNTVALESLSEIDHVVFDKTGTITEPGRSDLKYFGINLTDELKQAIKALVKNSSHPLSKAIFDNIDIETQIIPENYTEEPGKGISGTVGDITIMLGSQDFVGNYLRKSSPHAPEHTTSVYVSIDGSVFGYFYINNHYRQGLSTIKKYFRKSAAISILSGDNDTESKNLQELLGEDVELRFKQSPFDKLDYIRTLQAKRKKVLMFGDGLNDAGALRQSDVGISVSQDVNNFSPASDGILSADSFEKIPIFFDFIISAKKIIIVSFAISFFYNLIGIFFGFSGQLTPLVAAVLMPLSSISVVIFTTVAVSAAARKNGIL